MDQKIMNSNHSLSIFLNKHSKNAISSSTSIQLNRSRELFSIYMNDSFKLSGDDIELLDRYGFSSNREYTFLYCKNISLLLRRYVYNVLCVDFNGSKAYMNDSGIFYLNLKGKPLFNGLPYSRIDEGFLESCYFILKQRSLDLGFKDESFNKTLKNYLYGKATPLGSNLKTKIAFYLGMSIDNLNIFLNCLEITKNPTSLKEEIALNILSNTKNNYYQAYCEYQKQISLNIHTNKKYNSNNQEFVELTKQLFPYSIDDQLYNLGIDLNTIIKKKRNQEDMIIKEDEWSKYLIEFRNDILDDSTLNNIKKNNIPVKKRHILLLFFYKCLLNHKEYFIYGTHKEIKDYYIQPCNEILLKYGFDPIDYSLYFDKFLLLCLIKQNPAQLFNKILVNADYDLRRNLYE